MKFLKKGLFAASLTFTFSCCLLGDPRKEEVLMTDKDFVEFKREYSPDSTRMLLNYGLNLGAFGFSKCGTAILNLKDLVKDLRPFTLSKSYINVKWLNNQKVSAQRELIPFLRSGETLDLSPQKINSIDVEVSPLDFIKPHYHLEIEHRETSPNGQFELVAYRYAENNDNLNFIHVSVINKGEQIPKYGNYLIGERQSDYVFFGKWSADNQLIFYTNDKDKSMVQYCLIKNRPKIAYSLITNDTNYQNKRIWREK